VSKGYFSIKAARRAQLAQTLAVYSRPIFEASQGIAGLRKNTKKSSATRESENPTRGGGSGGALNSERLNAGSNAGLNAGLNIELDAASDSFAGGSAVSAAQDLDLGTLPVFVVGLMRSGSTLLDQILSSHSKLKRFGVSGRTARLRTGQAVWPKPSAPLLKRGRWAPSKRSRRRAGGAWRWQWLTGCLATEGRGEKKNWRKL